MAPSTLPDTIQPEVKPANLNVIEAGLGPSFVPPIQTGIFLQDACFQHRYIRSRDTSNIVERPERLRAVILGISAALARLEETLPSHTQEREYKPQESNEGDKTDSELVAAMNQMSIASQTQQQPLLNPNLPVSIIRSQASIDLLNHKAVEYIHGDIDGNVYLQNFIQWAQESVEKVAKGESEIPESLFQGDLYLCPQSINAVQGALGTVCEAVDRVMGLPSSSNGGTGEPAIQRAFVAIRPPGHHCGEDTPSGFCFVNNVAVAAAHAHIQYGVQRVVIFDIDLHHGNGTQSIIWQINEETYRQVLERDAGNTETKMGPQIFYGSLHDILSYPCEDGKPELVQAASVSIHKAHGQHIENIHLEPYKSEEHFWDVLYKEKYNKLIQKAKEFLDSTGGPGDDVLVFISCGFDACEHEYTSMSRHGRKVPVSFYHRFTVDVCGFSNHFARGRLVSVLEGGYSDRALVSGALAHLCGLVCGVGGITVDEGWWGVDNLTKLEKIAKQCKPGGRKSIQSTRTDVLDSEFWLERASALFTSLDTGSNVRPSTSSRRSSGARVPSSSSSMTLRDRGKVNGRVSHPQSPPPKVATKTTKSRSTRAPVSEPSSITESTDRSAVVGAKQIQETHGGQEDSQKTGITTGPAPAKKLPRVILRLGPGPSP